MTAPAGLGASAEGKAAVVGGGVIGWACAWRLAERGLDVTVIDATPGSGASHVAAGMLCPVTEVHYGEEPLLALTLDSARRWPTFAADVEAATEIDIGYRTEGTLAIAFDNDDLGALEELLRYQQSLGLVGERLSSRECREREPHLSARVRGGAFFAHDNQVDNRRLIAALEAAATALGVTSVRQHAARLTSDGVGLTDGTVVPAGRILLAAGCGSVALAPELPVRPVKGQIIRLAFDPADPPLARNVRGLAEGRSVYLVPRADGELVVGATVEEMGNDTTATAGAVHDLLRAAIDLVPVVSELELVETASGLRPGTPDNAPVIGASPERTGVVFATGHYRNGILLAPVTADAVVSIVADGSTPAAVAPFGIERFAT